VSRSAVFALAVGVMCTSVASAQQWADKMFETRKHDFGTVARGSKVEYRFKLTNPYKETVHIASVRSSCGCTTPMVEIDTLKTYEEGAIIAHYNTSSFTGYKSATLTVTIDQPYYAEVQLHVNGYIRSDVVFSPPSVQFGNVDLGTPGKAKVEVLYAGRQDWKLTDVRSVNPHFEVDVTETRRGSGQVGYELEVSLKEDAPAGAIDDQLILVTNDSRQPRIPLYVDGRVVSAIRATPSPLNLGNVAPGEKLTGQLIVTGKAPFKITGIDCDDARLAFALPDQAKKTHVLPVTFTADDTPGSVLDKVRLKTDAGEATADVEIRANVSATGGK